MASSNPFRVKDLLHKYGWDFMARLSSLGVNYQAEAQVLFVDSGATNALDADDAVHGHSFENPLATIDYATGLCTANEGAVVIAAPGHNEGLGNAQINLDVAGVTYIFLGSGPLRGRIDFDHANASINIGANGVTIVNLGLLPSVTGVLIGVDVETGVTDFKMVNCEFMIGEDGAGVDEFVKAITLTSGNHDCIFENVKILAHASAANATHGIHVVAASNRLTFRNVVIDGPYATGGIVEAAAGLNHIVEDCSVDTTGTNYSFHGSSTFAKRTRNLDAGASEDTSENLIGKNDNDNAVDTSNVAANIDGSVLERLEEIAVDTNTIIADAQKIDEAAVSGTPTANSLASFIATGGTALGTKLPASTSLYDVVKTLREVADGTDVYPAGVTTDSIIAKILSKADPAAANSFNNTTDSLEAIRDRIDVLLAAIPYYYLGTAEANAAATAIISADLAGWGDAYFVTDWVAVCVKDAGGAQAAPEGEIRDITGYTSATGTFTTVAFTAAITTGDKVMIARRELFTNDMASLKAAPATGSLASFVASGGTALGQPLPASTSLVDIIGNFTGPYNGADYDDNIFSCLKKISTYLADGDGDFATGTALPSNKSLYDIVKFLMYVADGGANPYPDSVAQESILAYLMSKSANPVTTSYDNTTDSHEALSDKLGGFSGDGGAAQDDSAKASLDLAHTDLDAILADTAELQPRAANVATKTITDLSGGAGNKNMFTVSGPVKVTSLIGIVANTIKAVALNAKIVAVPTVPGVEVDVTAVVDINAAAVGTTLTPGATFGAALVKTANGVIGDMGFDFLMDSGVIALDIDAAGDADDSIVWYVRYEPLSATATIVAA